MNSNNK